MRVRVCVCVYVCVCVCVMGGTLGYTVLYSQLTLLGPTLAKPDPHAHTHTQVCVHKGLVRVALSTVDLAKSTSSQ